MITLKLLLTDEEIFKITNKPMLRPLLEKEAIRLTWEELSKISSFVIATYYPNGQMPFCILPAKTIEVLT